MSNFDQTGSSATPVVEGCVDVRSNAPGSQTTVIVNQSKSNGVGTTGFVFALIGFFLCWVPILGWILWFVGALCSTIGLFKSPKGLAIAGFVISFIGLIILVIVGIGVLGLATMG